MSKILINNTASPYFVTDTGVNLPVGSYTIDPSNYGLWGSSSDVVIGISDLAISPTVSSLTVNDGSSNLSISDGTSLIQGQFPKKITGGSTGSFIGNVTDRLKVIDEDLISIINGIGSGIGAAVIFKQAEVSITTRTETDIAGTTYTVTTAKKFVLKLFAAAYDTQSLFHIRLKKQTAGAGPFNTLARLTLAVGGGGDSTVSYPFGTGVYIGDAGDVFKLTHESSVAKGTVWAGYTGVEV